MNKIFSFMDPVFEYLDGGKIFRQPFKIFYYIIGILSALACLAPMTFYFDQMGRYNGIFVIFCLFMSVVSIALAAFTIIYWFRRASELGRNIPENARFQAIPAIGGFVISWGEWLGITAMIFTFCAGIFGAVFITLATPYLKGAAFLSCLAMAILGPIISYIVMIIIRLIGEQILAIGFIANKTQKIAENTDQRRPY